MKGKMFMTIVLITMIAAVGVYASANPDGRDDSYPPGWGGRFQGEDRHMQDFSGETITVTGTLSLENWMHPELEADGIEYELLVPRFRGGPDLEEGEIVTVEGYTIEGMPCCDQEEGHDEIHLWVTKAIVDGEEFDLENEGWRGGMMGRGMMGGWRSGQIGKGSS